MDSKQRDENVLSKIEQWNMPYFIEETKNKYELIKNDINYDDVLTAFCSLNNIPLMYLTNGAVLNNGSKLFLFSASTVVDIYLKKIISLRVLNNLDYNMWFIIEACCNLNENDSFIGILNYDPKNFLASVYEGSKFNTLNDDFYFKHYKNINQNLKQLNSEEFYNLMFYHIKPKDYNINCIHMNIDGTVFINSVYKGAIYSTYFKVFSLNDGYKELIIAIKKSINEHKVIFSFNNNYILNNNLILENDLNSNNANNSYSSSSSNTSITYNRPFHPCEHCDYQGCELCNSQHPYFLQPEKKNEVNFIGMIRNFLNFK